MHYFLIALFSTAVAYADSIPTRLCRPTAYKSSRVQELKSSRSKFLPLKGDDGTEANPYIGDRRQLVVLVSFNDLSFKQDDPLPQWNRIFNERQFNEPPFCGSVHDYFFDQSNGQFRLTFDLYYVQLDETRAKYRSTRVDDENSQYLVNDIVEVLRTKPIDWSQYDWNDDGYVNQLIILYAGLGMHNGGDANTIWPHQWCLSEHTDSLGNHCQPLAVGSGDATYLVDSYCCVCELTKNPANSSFGIICHEYSHCFGLPDFYINNVSYIKEWDLMDSGNYNGGGYYPPSYSAHERMMMGWYTPTELTNPVVVTGMEAMSTQPEAYIIYNDANHDEYYVVENRQQTSWDTHLPGSGIIVFHVIYDAEAWASGTPNRGTLRYTIFPANNNSSIIATAGWAYPYEQNDSLTNDSKPTSVLYYPNTDDTKLMSKPLKNMKVENSLASFTFMNADPSSHIEELSIVNCQLSTIYDLTGRQIVNGQSVNRKLPRGLYISNGKKIFVR